MNSKSDSNFDRLIEKVFARLERDDPPQTSSPASTPSARAQVAQTNSSNRSLPKLNLNDELDEAGSSRQHKADNNLRRRIQTDRGPVWILQNAIMCACPDCSAPVSVRTWLMMAECWSCEISIELTEQQQRAVEELMQQQDAEPVLNQQPREESPTLVAPLQPATRFREQNDTEFAPVRMVQLIRSLLGALPAWLISTLFHVILLLILALILIPQNGRRSESITLSTAVTSADKEGGIHEFRTDVDPLQFDSALPSAFDMDEQEWREEVKQAAKDAEELQTDEPLPVEIDKVKENLTQTTGPSQSLLIRDPRLRNEIVKKNGGTTLTEAAVARGLRWLAQVQNVDGSWSLANYENHKDRDNQGDAAATSLALLPFLGAGQTHEHGRYKQTVQRGLKWLLDRQKSDGDLRANFKGETGMYVHGQATIVLVEALSMTGDEKLRKPCERAVRFVENAQHQNGGWRYEPRKEGDTSVLGWQVMALQSARNSGSGIPVDRATLKLASLFLDDVSQKYSSRTDYSRARPGALYRYMPPKNIRNRNDKTNPTPAMTAEGLLCRMYLGWNRDDPRVMQGVAYLMEHLPGNDRKWGDTGKLELYYWYYGTQVMHHYGGQEWEIWNPRIRDLLYGLQTKDGEFAGSWDARYFRWGKGGGRIYTTSLAVCTLEVYYRHLPLFERIEFDE